ncbi:hypothetical protein Cgig2_024717 [Carnegiea gigantea]|uniref:Uncharacterized protein n=1 Tax=Carnegiea gigantea TaxID=171969 RepID=A0A9Q1JST9_9CARY|nr:hypothetical protein Cgig2_024717 [Carnegiea gigantea]
MATILQWLLFLSISFSSSPVFADDVALVVGQSSALPVVPKVPVSNSPGSKPDVNVVAERVHVYGLSRMRNLKRFSHSVLVKVSRFNSSLLQPNVEVCFHRNFSLGIGMCPQNQWQKLPKDSWAQKMSPFDHKLLDIRMASSLRETLELTIEEGENKLEFTMYFWLTRSAFMLTWMLADIPFSFLSFRVLRLSYDFASTRFSVNYAGAHAQSVLGILLQQCHGRWNHTRDTDYPLPGGMKLLPTGQRSSLALFIYSSLVGIGSFLLRYLPRLFRTLLSEIGISEDVYYPVCKLYLIESEEYTHPVEKVEMRHDFLVLGNLFAASYGNPADDIAFAPCISGKCLFLAIFFLLFISLTGAWLGFWAVRKLILTEDGLIDTTVSQCVAWSIRILGAVMVLQSSLDPLLAAAALFSAIFVASILRRATRPRLLRRLYRKLGGSGHQKLRKGDLSPADANKFVEHINDFHYYRSEDVLVSPQSRWTTQASSYSAAKGSDKKRPTPYERDTFYSTYHKTPERRKYSDDEMKAISKEYTKKGLEELVSSPEFSRWAVAHAERLTLAPIEKEHNHAGGWRRLFSWFR